MDVQITRRHVKVSTSLQDALTEKLNKIQKFYEKITACHVVLDSEHTDKTAEVIVTIMGRTLAAKAKADTMRAAAEAALSKLERQLKKNNEKMKDHKAVKPE
ncbi:MAG: ribosome-associated translation inhibitor RaiA [Chitinivibrionales bacterium]|nr:ribosome-associated translation inhibitor RaiA [Chitinivibrionales bacterium]